MSERSGVGRHGDRAAWTVAQTALCLHIRGGRGDKRARSQAEAVEFQFGCAFVAVGARVAACGVRVARLRAHRRKRIV